MLSWSNSAAVMSSASVASGTLSATSLSFVSAAIRWSRGSVASPRTRAMPVSAAWRCELAVTTTAGSAAYTRWTAAAAWSRSIWLSVSEEKAVECGARTSRSATTPAWP